MEICSPVCIPNDFTTGNLLPNGFCECTNSGQWDDSGFCTPLCNGRGESGVFNSEEGYCICSLGYTWNDQNMACELECVGSFDIKVNEANT